jgi:folate-binding protein YgfZ
MSAPAVLAGRAAEQTEVGGIVVPAHFGDPVREDEAAGHGAGLTHRAGRALVRIGGEDRSKFLQGLLTNDIEALAPGEGCQALFLDTKGHVRGALDLWDEGDGIIAGCDAGFVDDALPDLTRYILAADVQIDDLRPDFTVLALMGATADDVLARAGAEAPVDAERAHRRAELGGVEVRLARTPGLGASGLEIHAPEEAVDDVWAALDAAGGESAPTYIGWDVAEALRVEAGIARLGHEITGEEFPQEVRLDGAVDYEKGCYLGQETVARIHYRGQVNRLLSGVRAETPLPRGGELISSGREVGCITSVAVSPRLGPIALALVRREESEGGATVEVRSDGDTVAEARVVTLPIGG